ncbi:MAG: NAD(P)-dependent oxidoreductase [Halobacteriovoraceae bacterium]|nr:NAD(P)-dependent oxidoreductase [Halobacteriovoraceae bacterium]
MILVTGSNGFIGKKLQNHFEEDQLVKLDPSYSRLSSDLNELKISGNTQNLPLLQNIFSEHSIKSVIHLGMVSIPRFAKENEMLARESIVEGTRNLLKVMVENKVGRIVFISSSMVYGPCNRDKVCETSPCSPTEPYGKLKLEAEQLVQEYAEKFGLQYIIIRPTSVYGEHDAQNRVVSLFLERARNHQPVVINGEETAMDFTYVDEVAEIIARVSVDQNVSNEIFNISRGKKRALLELAQEIKKYYPDLSISINPPRYGVAEKGELDIQKAKSLLGFNPVIELEDGLKRIMAEMSS